MCNQTVNHLVKGDDAEFYMAIPTGQPQKGGWTKGMLVTTRVEDTPNTVDEVALPVRYKVQADEQLKVVYLTGTNAGQPDEFAIVHTTAPHEDKMAL